MTYEYDICSCDTYKQYTTATANEHCWRDTVKRSWIFHEYPRQHLHLLPRYSSTESSTATEARDGGMCIRYGAKVKPKKYSSEGEECTNNIDQNGGICKRHGASFTLHDETTAFGSEFEKTTATLTIPNQNNPATADKRKSSGIPEEVVICQEIVEV